MAACLGEKKGIARKPFPWKSHPEYNHERKQLFGPSLGTVLSCLSGELHYDMARESLQLIQKV